MDFAFSEEQDMLRSQAHEFLADKFPTEVLIELEDFDRDVWKEMAALGWIGLSAPESSGGAGMSFLDEAVLFEELGHALYAGPYFSTVALALPGLDGHPDVAAPVVEGEAVATFAWAEAGDRGLEALEGVQTSASISGGEWFLTGDKQLVTDLDRADIVVVVARAPEGTGLWSVAVDDSSMEIPSTMDETRKLGRLNLEETPGRAVVEPGEAGEVLERIRLRAQVALALEAVGVSQKAVELAADYAKQRRQFERPIGAYQAVSHQVVNAYVETELARSLAYWAAWCVAESHPQAPAAAAAAKAFASDAAVASCERSIQVHGGIGFTSEHVLHRYYKRAQGIASLGGSSPSHRRAVAAAVLEDQAARR
jgi:alkylation response protein AidB-like acyl-CoA dehydrogenase